MLERSAFAETFRYDLQGDFFTKFYKAEGIFVSGIYPSTTVSGSGEGALFYDDTTDTLTGQIPLTLLFSFKLDTAPWTSENATLDVFAHGLKQSDTFDSTTGNLGLAGGGQFANLDFTDGKIIPIYLRSISITDGYFLRIAENSLQSEFQAGNGEDFASDGLFAAEADFRGPIATPEPTSILFLVTGAIGALFRRMRHENTGGYIK